MLNFRYPSEWIGESAKGLARLADRPWSLFVVLLAVNTLAQPYQGITHDARLYSVQVLNHVEHGAYADDFFFRYGSQDEYSLFSRLAAPVVHLFGLPVAFFVIYLLSKSLLLWGMMRFVLTLVPNRAAGAAALIYCMAVALHYGGQHILNVQENFVTPRILACALVLLGLEAMLHDRPIRSGVLLGFAAAIHPLMAFGGLLIWASFHLLKFAGLKTFVAAVLGVLTLTAVVLSIEPLGVHCFGAMDDEWRQIILHASSFNFASQWDAKDWCYLAWQLAILTAAIWKYRSLDAEKARFLAVLLLVTLTGAAASLLAENLPYALLLQGQPYRVLWMLAFLHYALAIWLTVEWFGQPDLVSQLAGCVLLAYLCNADGLADECVLPLLLFPLVVIVLRGLESAPRHPDWLVQSIQLSLVLGALGWTSYILALLLSGWQQLLLKLPECLDVVEIFLRHVGPIVVLTGACWLLVRLAAASRWRQSLSRAVTAAGCLGMQMLFFVIPQTTYYAEHGTHYRADLRVIHEMIYRDRKPGQALPTVYCNLGCLDYVWLDLHSQSYYDLWQTGNFMFRREMAVEGRRRAGVVGPFEIARYRKNESLLPPGSKEALGRFFQTEFAGGPVNKDDLARLCREPGLDFVVLEQPIDGVPAVAVGRLYLYSTADVRLALRQSVSMGGDNPSSK